jgi:hypothetical protein
MAVPSAGQKQLSGMPSVPRDAKGSLSSAAFRFVDSLLGFVLFQKLGSGRRLTSWMLFRHLAGGLYWPGSITRYTLAQPNAERLGDGGHAAATEA